MDDLTRTQVVMLVLLVSFVTSVATGIVTVTLVNQAPPPVTQTINKVIEKTVERVVPGENQAASPAKTVVITENDIIVTVVEEVSKAVASVVASKDLPVIEEYFVNPFPEGFIPDIKIPQYRQKGTEKRQVSSATGFFVSSDGLIVTNRHVVEDKEAEYSIVMNDGRKFYAEVLARDPFQDIAILKVDGGGFDYIPLGNSDSVKIGQKVIAIGNALGEFQNTVSIGIISGLNRSVVATGALSGAEELRELIQTDAAINQGNSGGPLLNLSGEVIGINTAIAVGAENVGFALPINIARRDIKDAKEFGMIKYPFIGVRYQVVNADVQEAKNLPVDYGLLLNQGQNNEPAVTKDSPADKAGLQAGDILLEFNRARLDSSATLSIQLSKSRVGDKISLKFLRGEEEKNISLVLEERPENI